MKRSTVQYLVICRSDRLSAKKAGPYVLATRQIFATKDGADAYRKIINRSRQPLVVTGRFGELRPASLWTDD